MTVEFENESTMDLGIDLPAIARQIISFTLDYMDCPYEAQVNVLVTGEQEIHEINLQQRGIDRATDVLSFPMAEYEIPGNFDFLEEESMEYFDPDSGELLLGDIVICADRVVSQASEYGHSVRREYAFLLTHSMLHLMGFDHMEEKDAAVMEQKQREILDLLKITR